MSCNCFWDCYWAGRAGQLVAIFVPCPFKQPQKSLRNLTRPSSLVISKVANSLNCTEQIQQIEQIQQAMVFLTVSVVC